MTKNIENWTYKTKAELEALSDEKLQAVDEELGQAMRAFNKAQIPFTDEMIWQLMVIPGIIAERIRKS